MKKLTFKSYLKRYIKELNGYNTLNLKYLTEKAKKNIRLVNSLILYSVLENKRELFNKLTDYKYEELLNRLTKDNFLNDGFDRFEFKKIYNSYLCEVNKDELNDKIKEKIRLKVLEEINQEGISLYKICKDLNIDASNMRKFLNKKAYRKVSIMTLQRVIMYLRKNKA